MSGIEIAGLALGAFPILTYTFDQYRDAKKAARRWWKIERTYTRLTNSVEYERLTFRLQLRRLLLPIDSNLDDAELEALLAEPGDGRWKGKEIEAALKCRLDESYDRYCRLLQDMVDALAAVSNRLGGASFQTAIDQRIASSSGRATASHRLLMRANGEFQTQRIKLALGNRNIEELLSQVSECNRKLDQLLRSVDDVALLSIHRRHRRPRANVPEAMLRYWQYASRMYALVARAWLYSGQSYAHLWLQHRTSTVVDLRLRMLYGNNGARQKNDESNPSDSEAWSQSELQIQLAEGNLKQCKTLCRSASQSTNPTVITAKQTSSQSVSTSHASTDMNEEIQDLCKAIESCRTHPAALGWLFDKDENCYSVFKHPPQLETLKAVSLWELLGSADEKAPNRSQRYEIALVLASAYLQFHATPWLDRKLSCKHIMIPQTSEDKLVYGKPFVSADFFPSPATVSVPGGAEPDTTVASLAINESKPNPPVEAPFRDLAIILMELCFAKRLEDHGSWSLVESCTDESLRKLIVSGIVAEWSAKVLGAEGPKYKQAVTWCLEQPADLPCDEEWRKGLAENAVAPLQQCCEWIKPIASS